MAPELELPATHFGFLLRYSRTRNSVSRSFMLTSPQQLLPVVEHSAQQQVSCSSTYAVCRPTLTAPSHSGT